MTFQETLSKLEHLAGQLERMHAEMTARLALARDLCRRIADIRADVADQREFARMDVGRADPAASVQHAMSRAEPLIVQQRRILVDAEVARLKFRDHLRDADYLAAKLNRLDDVPADPAARMDAGIRIAAVTAFLESLSGGWV